MSLFRCIGGKTQTDDFFYFFIMTFHITQRHGCLPTNRKRSDLFTNYTAVADVFAIYKHCQALMSLIFIPGLSGEGNKQKNRQTTELQEALIPMRHILIFFWRRGAGGWGGGVGLPNFNVVNKHFILHKCLQGEPVKNWQSSHTFDKCFDAAEAKKQTSRRIYF